MREITNRLKKCIAPKVIRTKPSLSLNISMAARELVTVASLFKASVTPNINQIETTTSKWFTDAAGSALP